MRTRFDHLPLYQRPRLLPPGPKAPPSPLLRLPYAIRGDSNWETLGLTPRQREAVETMYGDNRYTVLLHLDDDYVLLVQPLSWTPFLDTEEGLCLHCRAGADIHGLNNEAMNLPLDALYGLEQDTAEIRHIFAAIAEVELREEYDPELYDLYERLCRQHAQTHPPLSRSAWGRLVLEYKPKT